MKCRFSGLKIRRGQPLASSSLAPGTTQVKGGYSNVAAFSRFIGSTPRAGANPFNGQFFRQISDQFGCTPAFRQSRLAWCGLHLAEISGSDTFVHVQLPWGDWVVQLTGVHKVPLNAPISVYLMPDACYVFDSERAADQGGALLQLPAHAQGG